MVSPNVLYYNLSDYMVYHCSLDSELFLKGSGR